MGDTLVAIINQWGLQVGGPIASTVVLAWVVRVLWREAQQDQDERLSDLKQQFEQRLSDKNTELSQVWAELRSERDEKRRSQAACEGMERLLQREQDLTRAALDEAAQWRKLGQRGGSGRA